MRSLKVWSALNGQQAVEMNRLRLQRSSLAALLKIVETLKDRSHESRVPACLERVKGIEPSYEAWEAAVLPLNYTRVIRL